MAEDTVKQVGIPATLPKGFEGTLNGLEVVFDEILSFRIKNAASIDQAAELVHIHKLPVDYSYFDESVGKNGVHVTYRGFDVARVEQTPEEKVVADKAAADSLAEATAGEEDEKKAKAKK